MLHFCNDLTSYLTSYDLTSYLTSYDLTSFLPPLDDDKSADVLYLYLEKAFD